MKKLLQSQAGKSSRNKRDKDIIGRVKDVFRQQGNIGGTIKKNVIILMPQGLEHLADPLPGLFQVTQSNIHVAVEKISRQQIKSGIIGTADIAVNRLAAFEQSTDIEFFCRPDPEIKSGRALGIQVAKQGFLPPGCRQVGQVNGGCRLADSPFDIVLRDDAHLILAPTFSGSHRLASCPALTDV